MQHGLFKISALLFGRASAGPEGAGCSPRLPGAMGAAAIGQEEHAAAAMTSGPAQTGRKNGWASGFRMATTDSPVHSAHVVTTRVATPSLAKEGGLVRPV